MVQSGADPPMLSSHYSRNRPRIFPYVQWGHRLCPRAWGDVRNDTKDNEMGMGRQFLARNVSSFAPFSSPNIGINSNP